MFNNSEELLKYVKDEGVEMVDVRFCDLPGVMQHFTVPVSSFDQSVFDDGLSFDGVGAWILAAVVVWLTTAVLGWLAAKFLLNDRAAARQR